MIPSQHFLLIPSNLTFLFISDRCMMMGKGRVTQVKETNIPFLHFSHCRLHEHYCFHIFSLCCCWKHVKKWTQKFFVTLEPRTKEAFSLFFSPRKKRRQRRRRRKQMQTANRIKTSIGKIPPHTVRFWHTKFDMQIHVVVSTFFQLFKGPENNNIRIQCLCSLFGARGALISLSLSLHHSHSLAHSIAPIRSVRPLPNKLLVLFWIGTPKRKKNLLIKNSIALKNHNTNNGQSNGEKKCRKKMYHISGSSIFSLPLSRSLPWSYSKRDNKLHI